MKKSYIVPLLLVLFISNLFSASKKMVIAELYTSANCSECGTFDGAFKSIMSQNSNDVIPLVFHTNLNGGDAINKQNEEISKRFLLIYQRNSIPIPALWYDGTMLDYKEYNKLPQFIGTDSPVTLKVIENRTQDKLNIMVGLESDVDLKNHALFVFVVEDNINMNNAGTNGITNFRWIARRALPTDKGGLAINLGPTRKQGFTYSVDWDPNWNKDNISVVAFVQSFGQDEMYKIVNAARTGSYPQNSVISAEKETLDFGEIGEMKTMELLLLNEGLKPININNIAIEDDPKGVFKISYSANDLINPYGNVRVKIDYFPKEIGEFTAKLVVKSDADNNQNYKINLKAVTTSITKYSQVFIDDDTYDFGEVTKPASKTFTIKNIGTADLKISSIAFDYNDDDVYSIKLDKTSNLVVAPGESLDIPITFKPKEDNKLYFADLIVNSDSKNDSELVISLSGKSLTLVKGQRLVLSNGTNAVDLGELEIGANASVKITNTSDENVQITDINFEDMIPDSKDSEAFELLSNKSTWAAANRESSISFKFNPTKSKTYRVYLNVITKDNKDNLKIELSVKANLTSVYGNDLSSSGKFQLNVSPNPASDFAEISFVNQYNENLVLELYNSNGELSKELYSGLLSNNTIKLNTSNLANGKYFIIANINGKKEAYSLIINK